MSLGQDLRYATRSLKNSPGFTAVAVLTLAIGVGANVAIFSFVDAILLKPLPYAEPERIVRVLEKPPQGERNGISTLNFLDWQKDNTVFDFMSAQTGGNVTMTGGTEPVQLRGARVSAGYFKVFGITPALGRTFLSDEDQLGKHQVAILSHSLWAGQFGSDPAIVNTVVQFDGQPHTIVGVLPEGSAFDRAAAQVWRPLAFQPSNMTRDFHWLTSFARLKDGVTIGQAQASMNVIGARIANDFPASNKGWGVIVENYAGTLVGPDMRTGLMVLMSATGSIRWGRQRQPPGRAPSIPQYRVRLPQRGPTLPNSSRRSRAPCRTVVAQRTCSSGAFPWPWHSSTAWAMRRRAPGRIPPATGAGGAWCVRTPHQEGHVVNLYGRAVGTASQVPKAKRHDHLPGAKGYFNAAALQEDAGPLWVCEGAFDALALLGAGVPRVVAIFGVQGWRWEWAAGGA